MYLQLAEDRFLSKKKKDKPKKDKKRNPAASIALAPGRALFLAMVSNNLDGIATKLAKQPFTDVSNRWLKVGGNPRKLSDAINKGKGKKPRKINFLRKFKGGKLAEDVFLSEDLTDDQKAKIISLSTAAGTAIGTAVPGIGNAVGAGAGASLGGLIVQIYPIIRKAADDPSAEDENKEPEKLPDVPEGENVEDPNATATDQDKETFFSKYKTPLLIGGGLVALIGLYYFSTRKSAKK